MFGLFVVAGLICIASLTTRSVALGSSGAARSEFRSDWIKTYLEEVPGLPLVLPTELPHNYRWLGPSGHAGINGQAASRSSTFAGEVLDEVPVIELCIHARRDRACPVGASRLERSVGGVGVTVSLSRTPTALQRTFWHDVPLVVNLDEAWLR